MCVPIRDRTPCRGGCLSCRTVRRCISVVEALQSVVPCYHRSHRLIRGLTGPPLGSNNLGSNLASATYYLWNLEQVTLTLGAWVYLSLQDGVTVKSTSWNCSKCELLMSSRWFPVPDTDWNPKHHQCNKKNKLKTAPEIIFITTDKVLPGPW